MSDYKRIEFAAHDLTTLRGDFFQAERELAPAVVMLSGFTLPKETLHDFARLLRGKGVSVLAYDNRGFGSSDGLPRHEIDLYQQASDYSDAVTAAKYQPGVDSAKIGIWGIGHGASAAMIAAGNDPRLAAVVLHGPFPSGSWDAKGYPNGLLEQAWRDRETRTENNDTWPKYVKVFRDWEKDEDGDDRTVPIGGVIAYHLLTGAKAAAEAAQTPWENRATLQTFVNMATTEAGDHAYRIKHPTLYLVHEGDPFSPSPEFHRRVFATMGQNADLKVVPGAPDGNFGTTFANGGAEAIRWLTRNLI